MNKQKIKNILQEVLSDLELKIYFASLSGPLTIQELAKKANLNRSGAYRIVENLIQKGLLAKEIKKRGQLILAENPKKLIRLLDNQQKRLRRHELALQEMLPEILAEYKEDSVKPTVRYHEGKEGYYSICEQTLNSNEKDLLQIGNLDNLYKVVSPEYDQRIYIPKRIEKDIKTRMLVFKSPTTEKNRKQDEKCLRQTKFLPKFFLFNGWKYIFEDKVAIISSEKELVGLIIESQEIAKMERKLFEMIWKKL